MDTEIKRVAVVVFNWEGWQDTVVCLGSLDELTVRATQAIVVDNGSSDASVEHLVDWLHRHGKTVFDHDGYGGNRGEVTKSRRSQPVPHATATPQARILPDDCGAEALVVDNGLGTRYVLLQLRTNRGLLRPTMLESGTWRLAGNTLTIIGSSTTTRAPTRMHSRAY